MSLNQIYSDHKLAIFFENYRINKDKYENQPVRNNNALEEKRLLLIDAIQTLKSHSDYSTISTEQEKKEIDELLLKLNG